MEAAGQGGFTLFDEDVGKAFDDPAGEGVAKVADSAGHDAKAAALSSGEAARLAQAQAEPLAAIKRGDFYEFEGEQAKTVASVLDIALTTRNGKPTTGIPAHSLTAYRGLLESKGWTVAIDGEARAAVDPNIAAKTRQEADIAAQQPLTGARKTGAAQDTAMPEGLFGGAQEPTFDLGDGKGARTLTDIENELNAEDAGIAAIKACQV